LKRIEESIDQKVANHEGYLLDWEFLYDVASVLTRCHSTLQFTYPVVHYLSIENDNRKELVS
jgi:hypothetical protein